MTVDSAQHITCGPWAEDVGTINLPVSPGDVVSASLCLDTKPPGTAHYFLANQTTGQTINFTVDTGFPPAVTERQASPAAAGHPTPRSPASGSSTSTRSAPTTPTGTSHSPQQRRRHDGRPERHHPRPARHAHRLRIQDHLRRSLTETSTTANPARERTSQRCSHSATDVTEHEQTERRLFLLPEFLPMGTQARRLSVRCGVSARQQPAWMVPERTDRQAAIRSSQGATVGLPGSRRGS